MIEFPKLTLVLPDKCGRKKIRKFKVFERSQSDEKNGSLSLGPINNRSDLVISAIALLTTTKATCDRAKNERHSRENMYMHIWILALWLWLLLLPIHIYITTTEYNAAKKVAHIFKTLASITPLGSARFLLSSFRNWRERNYTKNLFIPINQLLCVTHSS